MNGQQGTAQRVKKTFARVSEGVMPTKEIEEQYEHMGKKEKPKLGNISSSKDKDKGSEAQGKKKNPLTNSKE